MRIKEKIIRIWAYGSGLLVIFLVLYIFGYIFWKGYGSINWKFITDVPKGMILGTEGGIAPAIIGSFLSTGIACIIAGIFGICTGIHLVFYTENKKIKATIQTIIQCMGGIPSIVLGLFGYTMFVLYLGLGRSVISGGLTLGIMIFPVVETRIEKAFKEVDQNLIKASYSMGISKVYTIMKIVIPLCRDKIISALVLAFGYAVGATAPIMFCMAVINSPISFNITKPSMSLSYHLYILLTQGISTEKAYGTAFVLMLVLLSVIILSQILLRKRK
ncbi:MULTISPECIES: PstA family ABC transporter permease [Fusobacterium]|uniref:PstA family ABC transporter permease n=1 Tax=Fusobacterium TaxID=848 RepID=UPI0008A55A83|nr:MULTISPECIES: ABC transporter permease subunit [Fusobacterium]OFL78468.1 phosphate ABC transporter permease [Fusobacterium sp. HMSC073F01]